MLIHPTLTAEKPFVYAHLNISDFTINQIFCYSPRKNELMQFAVMKDYINRRYKLQPTYKWPTPKFKGKEKAK